MRFRDGNTCISSYRNFDWKPLKIQKEEFDTYCINVYGIIHQNVKGKQRAVVDHFSSSE